MLTSQTSSNAVPAQANFAKETGQQEIDDEKGKEQMNKMKKENIKVYKCHGWSHPYLSSNWHDLDAIPK